MTIIEPFHDGCTACETDVSISHKPPEAVVYSDFETAKRGC